MPVTVTDVGPDGSITAGSSPQTFVLESDCAAGSLLLVMTADTGGGSGNAVTGVTDSQSNTYSLDVTADQVDSAGSVYIASSVLATALTGGVDTVSVAFNGGDWPIAYVLIVSVTDPDYGPLDVAGAAVGRTHGGGMTATITPTVGDFMIAFGGSAAGLSSGSNPQGWNILYDSLGVDGGGTICCEWLVSPDGAEIDWTPHNSADNAAIVIAAYSPPATPTAAPTPHTIKYWTTTLDTQFGAVSNAYPTTELPFTKVTFSKCFNQAGPFSATLNIEDEQVLNTNWINGTNPGKTFFWVIIDDQIVYGGRILNRTYNLKTQQVTISGTDFYGYWAQRLQAADYAEYIQTYSGSIPEVYAWAHAVIGTGLPAGAPAPFIAWQILQDAAAVEYSLPNLLAPFHGEGVGSKSDPDYWAENYNTENYVTFSGPIGQQQTVDSLLQQFIGMGANVTPFDGVGIDVATDVLLDENGNPYATVNVCWPRYGKTAAEQGNQIQVMDLSTVIDMEWNEDATAQATGIVEQLGSGGVSTYPADGLPEVDTTAIETWNYPLTEQSICHTSVSPSALSNNVLQTLLAGDRDLYAYPQLAPTVTVPIFNYGTGFSLTALPMGDDVEIFNPFERQGIYGLPSVPFPPKGENVLQGSNIMRVMRADVTIADQGVSTMVLTLNPPPGNPSPPGYL